MDASDRMIQKIYEAAANPDYWGALGVEIADFVGAGVVHLLLASLEDGTEYISLFPRGDPGFAAEYLRDYADQDFRVPRVLTKTPGMLIEERGYVSREEALSSPIHQELLPKYSIHDIVGANMTIDDCIGWFGVSTLRPGEDLDRRRKVAYARLTPHILQAYKTTKANRDLRISRDMGFGALDLLNAAVILLRGRKLVHANHAAARILDAGFLAAGNGRLVCRDPAENRRLARFQEALDLTGSPHIVIRDHRGGTEYGIRAHMPAPQFGAGRARPGAELVFSILQLDDRSGADMEEVASFCANRGVSRAELAVLHAVLNARNLREFAAARGVALATVQKQLKSAMAKLGLNSQKRLFQAFTRFQMFG